MEIRKSFSNISNMHIVRNCSSERCKKSIHSHSYQVELFFEAEAVDSGYMVMDFGLTKSTIKELINSFNNSYTLWDKDSNDFKNLINSKLDRVIEIPVSPSAEMFSVLFFLLVDRILKATEFHNGEGNVKLSKVNVHETRTGYATCTKKTFENLCKFDLSDIKISDGIKSTWKDPQMFDKLIEYHTTYCDKPFINPIVEQQV